MYAYLRISPPPPPKKECGSQVDNQILMSGCPQSVLGRRGHEGTQISLPCEMFPGFFSPEVSPFPPPPLIYTIVKLQ